MGHIFLFPSVHTWAGEDGIHRISACLENSLEDIGKQQWRPENNSFLNFSSNLRHPSNLCQLDQYQWSHLPPHQHKPKDRKSKKTLLSSPLLFEALADLFLISTNSKFVHLSVHRPPTKINYRMAGANTLALADGQKYALFFLAILSSMKSKPEVSRRKKV